MHDLFNRLRKKPNRQCKFPESLRTFATTLRFYSLKAYNYVRQTFLKCLPHPLTISKWYKYVSCETGICKASLLTIKLKIEFMKNENGNKSIFGNITMDEMSIRQHVELINGKEYGYIDVGKDIDKINTPEATNVLVVMLVCENGKFKIPISFYFIQALTGQEKAKIIKQNLEALNDRGVIITSITFDGLRSNVVMCNILGAEISLQCVDKVFFPHPVTKENVYIIFDGCHMLKLIRNAFGSGKDMYDSDGKLISWSFLQRLVEFQEMNGLYAGTKLKRDHIKFEQNKMNVKLAAQTLSNSVSQALKFLGEKDEDSTIFKYRKYGKVFFSYCQWKLLEFARVSDSQTTLTKTITLTKITKDTFRDIGVFELFT